MLFQGWSGEKFDSDLDKSFLEPGQLKSGTGGLAFKFPSALPDACTVPV